MKAVFFKLVFIVLVQWTAASQNTELTPTKTSPLDSVPTEDLKQKTLDVSGGSNELSLLFIGDFMGHLDQINAAYDKVSGNYNYDSSFRKITPILSDADVTIGNLEVTLGVTPYSGYPQFSSPPAYAAAIKKSGVDVLVTANNHSCDKRKKGVEKTIAILDSLNIGHTGTFINTESKQTSPAYVIEKNNLRIAIINYTYGTNSIPPSSPNIVNYLEKERVSKDVDAVNTLIKPDQIIAFVHWGDQYKDLPNTTQKEWFEYFKSLGVNIVIGAHPHVLQPMEWRSKTALNSASLVVYSLGNFVSHQRTFPRDGGAVLKLALKKSGEGVEIKSVGYHLIWVHEFLVENNKHYDVLSVKDFEATPDYFSKKEDYDKLIRFSTHARKLLLEHNINIEEY
jgi:poly-gamma-glutamate synthesis protein (capsule biosynthesis protein)